MPSTQDNAKQQTQQQTQTLSQWLTYIGQTHSAEIDMGLARVSKVAGSLGVQQPAPLSVIVAGTNGKGSTTVALEALLLQAGLKVGATLSPHITQFNERIRLQGQMAADAALCKAFAVVDAARGDTPLTYFEFATLAALWLFAQQPVDVAILEVGLGGRLDAFNLVDAQVAIITSIGLDHQAFLGNDRNTIGREKAGVLRSQQTAVFGPELPPSIADVAVNLGTHTITLGKDCHLLEPVRATSANTAWDFISAGQQRVRVANSALAPANCALALQAAELVLTQLAGQGADQNADQAAITRRLSIAQLATPALANLRFPGRFQSLALRGRDWVLDVGHNPLAAGWLLQQLRRRFPARRVVALFGQLADKDSAAIVGQLEQRIASWILVPTKGPRGQTAQQLAQKLDADRGAGQNLSPTPMSNFHCASNFTEGVSMALAHCGPRDVILAFGAFNVVEQVLLSQRSPS